MIEKVGDFWKELENGYDAAVCTTNTVVKSNGELVMGAGIALAFKQRYNGIAKTWGKICKLLPEEIICTHISCFEKPPFNVSWLVGLPTKHHWQYKSPIDLVVRSCEQLDELATSGGWHKILMTRPGCGNGGLDWNDVKKQISFLDDRFVVINNV